MKMSFIKREVLTPDADFEFLSHFELWADVIPEASGCLGVQWNCIGFGAK